MSLHPLLPWWAWGFAILAALLLAGLAVLRARPGDRRQQWTLVGLVVLLGLIALHPGVGRVASRAAASDLDVLVVVDRTTSMSAPDWSGKARIDGVKHDATRLADGLAGSRFALLTWGGQVRLEMPFTRDRSALLAAVKTISPEGAFVGKGSNPDRALAQLTDVLSRARAEHPDRRRVVLFFSDGEVTESSAPVASFAAVRPLVDAGAVLGYGTTKGSRMPVDPAAPDQGWITDPGTGDDAVSKLDPVVLQRIADQLGVDYADSPLSTARLDDLAASINRTYAAAGTGPVARYDVSWILGLALGLLGLSLLRPAVVSFTSAVREARAR